MSSLKIALESWAMGAVASAGGILTGIQTAHVDDSSQVKQERLIFGATVHSQELQGAQYFPTDLQIELRDSDRDAANSDAIFAFIEQLFKSMSKVNNYQAATYFTELIFFPEEMDSKADRSDNSRIRSRTYPFRVVGIFPTFDSTLITFDSTLYSFDSTNG
jgi:hypothetical protein